MHDNERELQSAFIAGWLWGVTASTLVALVYTIYIDPFLRSCP